MKVIAVFNLEVTKESSIKIGVLIDQSLDPMPNPLKAIIKLWDGEISPNINDIVAKVALEMKKVYDSVGTLVVIKHSHISLAAALDEVLEDPDVKFEMYKLMGF